MSNITVHDKTFVPYINEEEVQALVKATALKIYEDYKDETPIFVGVLNGVFMFFSDLLKYYPGECEVAFLQMSSYAGTQSTGSVKKKMDLNKSIEDRSIIIVEDIVDTGRTMQALVNYLNTEKKPKSIRVASLLLKPEVYNMPLKIDYVAREIPNKFVVGYGLDYDELGRNLSAIYQVSE